MKVIFPIDDTLLNENIPAIMDKETQVSFYEYALTTQQLCKWLQQTIAPNDKVAIFLPTNKEYVFIFIALLRLGAIIVPLNTYLQNEEIEALLQDISCKIVITDELFQTKFTKFSPILCETIPWQSFLTNAIIEKQQVFILQPATIVFTSGSSGKPKAVLHTFANHYYSALGSNEHIPLNPNDKWLLSLPLYHVAGIAILFRCLVARATLVIGEKDILESLIKYKITHASLVVAQLYQLLKNIPYLLMLKCILLGGSAFSISLIKEALKNSLPIYLSYGLTEMSSQVATTKKIENEEDIFSARILPYREIKISSQGEILLKGATLCLGYLENNEIKSIVDEEEWFHSKDYGNLDENGYLKVYGRKDYMFISGGENIHPQEIEQKLCSLPEVLQAIVVPIPHPKYGFRPVAFVRTHNKLDDIKLQKQLRQIIAGFKVPDKILPWPKEIESKGIKPNRENFIKYAQHHQDN